MGDLEDHLLKKNIPGKYTWWEEYEHDDHGGGIGERSEDDDDDDDDDDNDDDDAIGKDPPYESTLLPNVRPTTGIAGPKGVLADKKLHDELDRLEREQAYMEQQFMLERWSRGVVLKLGEVSLSGAAIEERKRQAKRLDRQRIEEEEEELDKFETEDQPQRLYRLQLQQLREVDQEGFTEIIDKTAADTPVIVFLYENHLPDCLRLNRILDELSQFLPACFIKMKASVALALMDPIGLPSVSIYRGGVLVENLTPITQELPKNFEINHVRMVLEKFGVKQSVTFTTSLNVLRLSAKASHSGRLDREGIDVDFDSEGDGYYGID